MCFVLFSAGIDTVAGLLGNAILLFAEHPGQRRLVQEDPERLSGALEEALRYESPLQFNARTTTRQVRMSGTAIPAGEQVLLLYGSANRDESRFEDPARFDVTRPPKRHVRLAKAFTSASAPPSRGCKPVSHSEPCSLGRRPTSWRDPRRGCRPTTCAASPACPSPLRPPELLRPREHGVHLQHLPGIGLLGDSFHASELKASLVEVVNDVAIERSARSAGCQRREGSGQRLEGDDSSLVASLTDPRSVLAHVCAYVEYSIDVLPGKEPRPSDLGWQEWKLTRPEQNASIPVIHWCLGNGLHQPTPHAASGHLAARGCRATTRRAIRRSVDTEADD